MEGGVRQADINPIRAGWLDAYARELNSGKWGQVISVWFDEPRDGDIPWEPCAVCQMIMQGRPMFIVVVEDFLANPRRLKLWAKYEKREFAFCQIIQLRPWNIQPTHGYMPTSSEWNDWQANVHEWDLDPGRVR